MVWVRQYIVKIAIWQLLTVLSQIIMQSEIIPKGELSISMAINLQFSIQNSLPTLQIMTEGQYISKEMTDLLMLPSSPTIRLIIMVRFI